MSELRRADVRVTVPTLDCRECGQPGHVEWDCLNAFAVLRAYERADRARSAMRTLCQHGERLMSCLGGRCRDAVEALRNPRRSRSPALPRC